MKKLLFVLSFVLTLTIIGCQVAEIKDTPEPATTVIQINENICVEHYKYDESVRSYYFRVNGPLDYLSLINALVAIDGVKDIRHEPYTMHVIIARSYSWGEVEPVVLSILNHLEKYRPVGV